MTSQFQPISNVWTRIIVMALLALLLEALAWDAFSLFHIQYSSLALMHRDLGTVDLLARPWLWSRWWQWPFPLAQVVFVIMGSIGLVKSLFNNSDARTARLLRLVGIIVLFMLVRAIFDSVRALR